MIVYHGTTVDKLLKMNGIIGIGKKTVYFTTDKTFAVSFARRRCIGRGIEGVVLVSNIDDKKADNYYKSFWKTRERGKIKDIIEV